MGLGWHLLVLFVLIAAATLTVLQESRTLVDVFRVEDGRLVDDSYYEYPAAFFVMFGVGAAGLVLVTTVFATLGNVYRALVFLDVQYDVDRASPTISPDPPMHALPAVTPRVRRGGGAPKRPRQPTRAQP